MRGVEVAKKTIVKVWRFIFGDNRKPKPYEMYNRMNKINAPSYRKTINNVMCVENRPVRLFERMSYCNHYQELQENHLNEFKNRLMAQ